MTNINEIVLKQLKDEFADVVGYLIPDADTSGKISIDGRSFEDTRELGYYMANRMWDIFDEILATVEVDDGVSYDEDETSPCCGASIVRGDLCSDCLEHCL